MNLDPNGMPVKFMTKVIIDNGKEWARLEKLYKKRLEEYPNDKLYTSLLKKATSRLEETREKYKNYKMEN